MTKPCETDFRSPVMNTGVNRNDCGSRVNCGCHCRGIDFAEIRPDSYYSHHSSSRLPVSRRTFASAVAAVLRRAGSRELTMQSQGIPTRQSPGSMGWLSDTSG
uniref:Uncharacterized protein n=1 Tax=uncultured bacterium fosmid pJB65E1 TaxID=1478066 RepID=A0A0H3U7W3_9BACT|nr:hypothetical protein [uncultured bacterium fosmid pJB65E1]